MVTYVVVRPEVGVGGVVVGGGDPRRRWRSTEVLASRYTPEPDPVQRALLAAFHRIPGNVYYFWGLLNLIFLVLLKLYILL